jgi:hypothetical protein
MSFALPNKALQADGRVRRYAPSSTGHDISLVVDSLHAMSSKREGEVRLGAAYEHDEVVLAMNDCGQLFVRGRLVTYGEGTHRLEFQFRTDQTALKPFVQALGSLLVWAK